MLRSPNRVLGLVLGAIHAGLGVAGFTVTADVGFFATPGALLFGFFAVNPAQNLLHLLAGLALLVAAVAGMRAARSTNAIVGTALLVLGLAGLFLVGEPFDVLALNVADNVLHLASSVMLLAAGLGAERVPRPTPSG